MRVAVFPSSNDKDAADSVIEVTSIIAFFTVTVQAVLLPPAEAVIVAVPSLMAVTIPLAETTATVALELVHVIVLSVAFVGKTVAVRVVVCPSSNDNEVSERVIEVTSIIAPFTVTTHLALFPPADAIISVVPPAIAVTMPVFETVATATFELVQVIVLSVASEGDMVAVSVAVCPSSKDNVVCESVMEETATIPFFTVTVHVALWLPAVALTVVVPSLIAVTSPVFETVATAALELVQVTVLSVALVGTTVATRVAVCPSSSVSVV